MHNRAPIQRRKSKRIYVGNVPIGDGAPIAVQSMTNTRTTDVAATVNQIKALERVGADIVRVSVPTMDAAEAFKLIKQQVNVPLVADIHFDYRIALKVAEYGVDCLRINPGNIGNEERIRMVVDCARDKNIPIRIGVNAGSLEKDLQEKYGEPTPQALLESAMRHVDHLDRLNFDQFKVSVKASDVFGGGILSSAGETDRSAAASRDHRSGRRAQRRGKIGDRSGTPAVRGDRRYAARLAGGGSGGRDQGRLRYPQISAYSFPRH